MGPQPSLLPAGFFKPALLCDAWLKQGLQPDIESGVQGWNTESEPGAPYFTFSDECEVQPGSLTFPPGSSAELWRAVPFYLSTRDGLTLVLRFQVLQQPAGVLQSLQLAGESGVQAAPALACSPAI